MKKMTFYRGTLATLACLSLGACFGSSGGGAIGGGGGGGGTPPSTAYNDNLTRVQGQGPQTVRQTGTINYAGQTRVVTNSPGSSTPTGFLVGDVALAANFDAGSLSGTATNFAGEVDGTAVTLAGTLDTANSPDPNIVAQTDIALPPVAGGGTATQGNLIGNMRGTLTESINNQSSTVQLTLIGNFTGANATGAQGTAAALVGDENATGFGLAGGGTFYVDRQ